MKKHTLLLTTGDVDGIGLEVAIKALCKIKIPKNVSIVCIRSKKSEQVSSQKKLIVALHKKTNSVCADSFDEALSLSKKHQIVDLRLNTHPAQWVETAAIYCQKKIADGLVTGPLSKPEILAAGMGDLGHTDILKRICDRKTANMGFVGKHFAVVLATGHTAVVNVESQLTDDCLDFAVSSCHQLISLLTAAKKKKPIAVLGLNPHAGDSGLIGHFEQKTLIPWLRRHADSTAEKNRISATLVGPLVPDVAFQKNMWNRFSIFLALYHDQGLIPFKTVHGQTGAHITLGLPILRTSVDHGTAKDIYGKNLANPASMIDAIELAIKITKNLT